VVPVIESTRLDLVSMSPAFLEAMLAGRDDEGSELIGAELPDGWAAGEERFLRLRLEQMRRDPAREPWLIRALVPRGTKRTMIGHAGFHGPPGINGLERPDAVELGYTVLPPFRGRGYATEAAAALMAWAQSEHGIRHFVASVAPGNEPSLAVVRKLGFVRTGQQWDDEDGLELVFELDRGLDSPAA
jgi:[ribosomal protein S5]-alanine N-acetyltransferase